VPLVVVGHRAGAAFLHRQAGLSAVEGLDLRLLVDRKHHGMGRRIDVQADDVREFLSEGRVVRQLELPPAVRAEAVGLPDRLHRRRRDAGDLRHRAQRPVGRFERWRLLRQADDLGDLLRRNRRLAGRTRLVAQQTVDAFAHEPLLPAPYAGFGLACPGHDRRGPGALVAQKDDPRPPDMLLRAGGGRDDRIQAMTVVGRDGEADPCAHGPDSHGHTRSGIPKPDSFDPINPLGGRLPSGGR